jgi:hypothetical protein
MADAPKTMAERHRDEIQGIIDACEEKIAPHKVLAFWNDRSDTPKPIGHNLNAAAQASRAITQARAACSKAIAAACERHRAEANAPPPVAAVEPEHAA